MVKDKVYNLVNEDEMEGNIQNVVSSLSLIVNSV
jgi:hypothetical protein